MTTPTIYTLRSRHKLNVTENHRKRVLHDLDTSSSLSWTAQGVDATAHWRWDGTAHHIVINQEIVSLIQNKKMLAKAPHRRSEGKYVTAVHNHEAAHALYTSRDFEGLNASCKYHEIPFRDINLFEDARIEGLFRQKRPTSISKTNDMDHEGRPTVVSHTYGVRKFEWLKWDTFNTVNPRNAFLSVLKCEGTKKNLEDLRILWNALYPVSEPFVSAKTGNEWGLDSFITLWRKLAGRGAQHRFPTTECIIPLVVEFNKHFPCPPGEKQPEGLGGSDFSDALKAAGIEPHGAAAGKHAAPEIPKLVDKRITVEGLHDGRKTGMSESDKAFEDQKHQLDPNYFDFA